MLPNESTAGFPTGIKILGDLDADIASPRLAAMSAGRDHQLTRRGSLRHAYDHAGVGPDHDRRFHIADGDARTLGFRQARAANLKLAARDGRLRSHGRNLRTAVRVLLRCHKRIDENDLIRI